MVPFFGAVTFAQLMSADLAVILSGDKFDGAVSGSKNICDHFYV